MNRGSTRRLDWFLGFLREDLEQVSMEHKVEIGKEMAMILGLGNYDGPFVTVPPSVVARLVGHRGDELKRLQQSLKNTFQEIMTRFMAAKKKRKTLENTWTDKTQADRIRRLYSVHFPIRLTLSLALDEIPRVDGDSDTESLFMTQWESGALDRAELHVSTVALKDEDSLLYRFLQDLNGVPISALMRCKECHGWFVHVSQRERLYCSNRCAAKKANRDRYRRIKGETPDAYEAELQNGRERAHRSYKRKVEKVLPGAKVERRPLKKGKKEQ